MNHQALQKKFSKIYSKEHRKVIIDKSPFVTAAIITGLVAVGFARTVELCSHFATKIVQNQPYLIFALTPICFVLGRLVIQYSSKHAAGSGIPQVMAALDQDQTKSKKALRELLGLKTAVAKIVSTIFCTGGGGLVGREGPMIQISAAISFGIGQLFHRFIGSKIDHLALLIGGGAAGIAAAFNTPLGGIVFAIEELTREHFAKIRTGILIAVIIAGFVAQSILGEYLYIGNLKLHTPSVKLIIYGILLAVMTGIAGGMFCKILIFASARVRRFSNLQNLLVAALSGLVVAGLIFSVGNHSFSMGSGVNLIRAMIFKDVDLPVYLIAERYLGSIVSFLSGCAGGIFAPALTIGAVMGKVLSGMFDVANSPLLIVSGMVGYLAAVTRAPFTSLVLVIEMTGAHSSIFFAMLVGIISISISRSLEAESYYQYQTKIILDEMKKSHTMVETL